MSKQIECEIYSRCCGFYRPVNQYNHGKQSEFADRVTYSLDTIKEALREGEI
jgi:anaerobic ribonucleoside-triphosphate reductase